MESSFSPENAVPSMMRPSMGRDTVGVDHEIGGDSVGCERHVALVDEPSDDSLLSEPGAELVAQLGDPLVPDLDTDEPASVLGLGDHDGIDVSLLSGTDGDGRLPALLRGEEVRVLLEEPGRGCLSDEDIGTVDLALGGDETVLAELRIGHIGPGAHDVGGRDLEVVLLSSGVAALLGTVGPHERGPAETPLDGTLVHDQRILDVVPVVREDGDAEVLSCGPVLVFDVLHGLGLDHRDLGVLHQVASGVGPDPVVGGGDPQRLLTHSRTHCDTGGGVVLRVRNDSGGDSNDDHGVDLHMGVIGRDLGRDGELLAAPPALEGRIALLAGVHPVRIHLRKGVVAAGAPAGQVVGLDEDERVLLLFGVDPLDDALAEQVVPADPVLADPLDVLPGEDEPAVLDDEQGPSEAALIAVDDDLSHLLVPADVDLVGQKAAAPALPDVVDELGGGGVGSH